MFDIDDIIVSFWKGPRPELPKQISEEDIDIKEIIKAINGIIAYLEWDNPSKLLTQEKQEENSYGTK